MTTSDPLTRQPAPPSGDEAIAPPRPTTRIDNYELIYRLGTGGMGNVYLARRRNESGLQRLFAVKAMHEPLSADPDFAKMFLDEAHIASQLHHINVVGIVDLGRSAGRLYMVMDYVEGPTLAQLLALANERPPAIICAIVIDMLRGLHAAHSLTSERGELLDLVHRDVSPSNILVGADGVARLTDFGIAKARTRRTSTSPGVRKGKLSYSAPEQITNPGSEDPRVDVFAAGVVLWNALTGSKLFESDNEAAVILSVINAEIAPPSTVGGHPPACLDEVCLRALERDPARRYASAAEMADDLRRVTRENDLQAGTEQVAEWVVGLFGPDLERRRAAIRQSATLPDEPESNDVLAVGTGPEVRLADAPGAEPSAEPSVPPAVEPPPAPSQRTGWTWAIRAVAVFLAAGAVAGAMRLVEREPEPPATSRPAVSAPRPAEALPASPVPAAAPAPVMERKDAGEASAPATEPAVSPPDAAEKKDEVAPRPAARPHRRRRSPGTGAAGGTAPAPPPTSTDPDQGTAPPAQPDPQPDTIENNPYLRYKGTPGG